MSFFFLLMTIKRITSSWSEDTGSALFYLQVIFHGLKSSFVTGVRKLYILIHGQLFFFFFPAHRRTVDLKVKKSWLFPVISVFTETQFVKPCTFTAT